MKVLVMMEHDYDYSYPVGAFIVPDDFDYAAHQRQWQEETFEPVRWKNQHGSGVSTKWMGRPTISFAEWLRKKYEAVEVLEV